MVSEMPEGNADGCFNDKKHVIAWYFLRELRKVNRKKQFVRFSVS